MSVRRFITPPKMVSKEELQDQITTTQIAVAETYGEMDDVKAELTDTQIAVAELIEIILGGDE